MTVTNYVWDSFEDNITEEYDENGTLVAEYFTEPTLYGNVHGQNRTDSGVRFYQPYVTGSTVAITRSDAEVTDTRQYEAFGEIIEATGTTNVQYQFVGRYGYSGTHPDECIYVRQRMYLSTIARWLSVDPLNSMSHEEAFPLSGGHATSTENVVESEPDPDTSQFRNAYMYCANAPLKFVDPSGKKAVPKERRVGCNFKLWHSHTNRKECQLGAMQRYECCKFRAIAAVLAVWYRFRGKSIVDPRFGPPTVALQCMEIYLKACKSDLTYQITECTFTYPGQADHPSTNDYLEEDLLRRDIRELLGLK